MMSFPLALGMPQGLEWIIIAAVGLLLFGKRLPEVGRSLGKGIVEFKRGLKGIADEVEEESSKPTSRQQSALPPKDAAADAKWPPEQPRAEDVRVSRSDKA